MIGAHTRLYALVGHPVRRSLSPRMHNVWFNQAGIDAVYVALEVDPDRAGELPDALRTLGLAGVNLTVPFKEQVIPHLDVLTPAARQAGAVNVVLHEDGFLIGDNTDGAGLVRALDEEHAWRPAGQRCVVLGAGGAARAIAAALAAEGAARVTLLNRTRGRAAQAVAELSATLPPVLSAGGLTPAAFAALAPETDLVVNALGGGAEAAVEALPIDALPAGALWVDTNYWMAEPPRLAACAARGLRTATGLGMLIHQGALAFERFTGQRPSVDGIRLILSPHPGHPAV